MRIVIGADEVLPVATCVVDAVRNRGHEVELVGPLAGDAMEWAEVGYRTACAVARGDADVGIVLCWSGTGVAIAANKVPGARAALCTDAQTARLARTYDHANLLALSMRLTTTIVAEEILDGFFDAPFGTEDFDLRNIAFLHDHDGLGQDR
jgi:RpiB/LacA/LacB family sugar-phosphate isomerase